MYKTIEDFADYSQDKPVHQVCYEAIRNAIICGMIVPGEHLLEMDLARLMHASRTPVRKALKKLEANGLVVASPNGCGMIVKGLGIDGINNMYAIQADIEQVILPMSLRNIKSNDIDNLRSLCVQIEKANSTGQSSAAAAGNEQFHRTIYSFSKFPGLVEAVNWIYGYLNVFNLIGFTNPTRSFRVISENQTIIEAIEMRDLQLLLDLYKTNIDNRRYYVIEQYKKYIAENSFF